MDGRAIIYCEGAFNTPNGKTAHGLVRFTERYKILSVVDSNYAGEDAGEILDGIKNNIPVYKTVRESVDILRSNSSDPDFLVIGIAPDGGRLTTKMKQDIMSAIDLGLNIDSGLHDYLSEDHDLLRGAVLNHVYMRDIRKPPPREQLHFFSGKIEEVICPKLAVLGTDSAIGKRTTAWLLVRSLKEMGFRAEMVGTGQTAWMQGVKYGIVMDSLVNDFVSGEIEHAVHSAYINEKPDIIIIEGQGSLLNPAYPGGFEILAAARPDAVILQHAPRRLEYDGFPGYRIESIDHQIRAIEIISGKKVVAVTLNHENMKREELEVERINIFNKLGLPSHDLLWESAQPLAALIADRYLIVKH
jgi:uncharacterized NAD-dependent epimerase/dehydratase family protein